MHQTLDQVVPPTALRFATLLYLLSPRFQAMDHGRPTSPDMARRAAATRRRLDGDPSDPGQRAEDGIGR